MDQRANRMKTLIISTFFDCLEELDFTKITIGKISDKAMINRSTFYRYFSDKYILRDTIVDDIVKDFAEHMEVDFLHIDIRDKDHTKSLEYGLSRLSSQKRELELLWNQPALGRNVFDEMINAGAAKVENEIKKHPAITPEKKRLADWYSKLLVNNYLVTVRWWFAHGDAMNAKEITEMMERHMIYGTVSTLLKF